jgi:uncharacterized protein with GYD domain
MNACVLLRTVHGKFEEVVKAMSQLKGVKRVFPTLGRFDVVVDVETESLAELDKLVLRIGNFAGVVFTETLLEIQHQEVRIC